jgi:hypothetical protein
MTRQRYTKEESVNRIRNLLTGDVVSTSDAPNTLQGPVMNFEEALSDIAELCANSLPSETVGVVPEVFVSSVDEANAYTNKTNTKALTPASHAWAHEYGGIYVSTGTTAIAYTQDTWTKVTGTFASYMNDSGSEIDCDWNDDRITINETGVYFVTYQLSIWNYGATGNVLRSEVYSNGFSIPYTRAKLTMGASGTVHNMFGMGNIYIVSGTSIDLRLMVSVSNTLRIDCAQLHVSKLNG